MRFSIIIPVYKVEKYLHECIESILNQTYSNFELILVDDGSPDNCPKICDEYAKNDNRIKVIHKSNGGLVSARKAGINVATGDYVIPVDGDDYVATNLLSIIEKILIEHEVDVVCFDLYRKSVSNCEKTHSKYLEGYYDKTRIKKEIIPSLIESSSGVKFPNSICGKVFEKNIYKKYQNLVDEKVSIAEDFACTKPLIYHCNNLCIIHECLYYYRQNDQSMTKKKKPFSFSGPEIISSHISKLIHDNEITNQTYRFVVHNLFNVCCSQFNSSKSYKVIKKEIKEELNKPIFKEAIKNCKYSIKNLKGNLALISLKYNLFWFVKLFSRLK